MDATADTLLTTTQVARLKGLSRKTVWQCIQDGRLPAHQYGDRWLVRQADVRALDGVHARVRRS